MRFFLAAPLLLAAISASAHAQDVQVFSKSSAEDILNAPPARSDRDDTSATCPKDEIRAADGTCVRTRRFSLGGNRAAPAPANPQLTGARPGKPTPVSGTPRNPPPRRSNPGSEVPLQFALGSFELSPQSMANLRTLAATLNERKHRNKRIEISGHSDRTGRAEVNLRLSQQRADAAAAFLVGEGVNPERIDAVGRGYEAPLAGFDPYNARQRRVEVTRIK